MALTTPYYQTSCYENIDDFFHYLKHVFFTKALLYFSISTLVYQLSKLETTWNIEKHFNITSPTGKE